MKVTAQNVDQLIRDELVATTLNPGRLFDIVSWFSAQRRDTYTRARKSITVSIDPAKFDNPVHQGQHELQVLRDAKVPATGVLHVSGVESGALTIAAADIVDGMVSWTWVPE